MNTVFHLERNIQLLAAILNDIGTRASYVLITWLGKTASFLECILTACDRVSPALRPTCMGALVGSDSFAANPGLVAEAIKIILRKNLEGVFGLFVQAAQGAGAAIAEIVSLVLRYGGENAAPWLDKVNEVISLTSEDHLKEIIQLLSTATGGLLERFITWLLGAVSRAEAPSREASDAGALFGDCIAILLSLPQKIYADSGKVEGLFSRLFKAMVSWLKGETDEIINGFVEELFTWLDAARGDVETVFGGMPDILAGLADHDAIRSLFNMPLPFLLAGKALMAALPDPLTRPGECAWFMQPLFKIALPPAALTRHPLSRPPFEDVLMRLARLPGFAVWMLPFLLMHAAATPMDFVRWIGKDIRDLQPDLGLAVMELEKPSQGDGSDAKTIRRYMIFSDTHRDWPRDDIVDPQLFDTTNFRKTKEVYKKALLYCENNHYTVIENGDCEELWYASSIFSPPTSDRAQGIVEAYDDIYTILGRLYNDRDHRRYYRTQGNHDSFWHEGGPDALAPLRNSILPRLHDLRRHHHPRSQDHGGIFHLGHRKCSGPGKNERAREPRTLSG